MEHQTASPAKLGCLLTVGKWVLVSYSLTVVFLFMLIGVAIVHELASGQRTLSLPAPGPLASVILLAVFICMFAAMMSWLVFLLLFLVALRKSQGADSTRQASVVAACAAPFWNVRYYKRVAQGVILPAADHGSQPADGTDAAGESEGRE